MASKVGSAILRVLVAAVDRRLNDQQNGDPSEDLNEGEVFAHPSDICALEEAMLADPGLAPNLERRADEKADCVVHLFLKTWKCYAKLEIPRGNPVVIIRSR